EDAERDDLGEDAERDDLGRGDRGGRERRPTGTNERGDRGGRERRPTGTIERGVRRGRERRLTGTIDEDRLSQSPVNFEQLEVPLELFGKSAAYLQEDLRVKMQLYDGRPLSGSVPKQVTCSIKETQANMKGTTVTPRCSHQFKVSNGDSIVTEKLKYCAINDKLILNKVLLLGSPTETIIGRPIFPCSVVHAVVEEQGMLAVYNSLSEDDKKEFELITHHTIPVDDEDYMKLAESKKGLSRYILDGSLPMDEILIAHDDKKCNRTALWTLCTDVMLDPNVITSVAFQRTVYEFNIMEGLREDGRQCFLPANLQVFIPMKDDNEHWYLAVILVKEKMVYVGDCCPNYSNREIQTTSTIFMMNFTTELLKLVYAKSGTTNGGPNISEFQLEFPAIFPEQKRYDSGLWVCSWIAIDSKYLFSKFGPYYLVNRKELAVDLVMAFENSERKNVLTRADTYKILKSRGVKNVRRYLDFDL
ncbi:50S ribosomal protein L21, mitochondrial, partial [Linum perenne]